MDLQTEFLGLTQASSEAEFIAIDLSPVRRDFLAKSKDGSPVFLFHDASAAKYAPGLKLKNLTVEFHVTCRVQTATGPIEDQFAMVSCDDSVPELFELFIRCFAAAAERFTIGAGTSEIKTNLQGLLDLFRTMSLPSGRAVSGLWAELFVIAKSAQVEAALRAWRTGPFDRFDFSWENKCLEVKATTHALRAHEFALEQLQPPVGGEGFVASLLLQQLGGGTGVMALATAIETSVSGKPELRQKLWENIASALGSEFSGKLDVRFDISYAERNFCIFAMGDVPAPSLPNDGRISSIRFQSDLTSVKSSLTPGSLVAQLANILSDRARERETDRLF
jgi:hypothetical protein